MSTTAIIFVKQASPTASSLGLGMIPNYPESLLLSDSVSINCIIADIPFFITGMLGFAMITFFMALRKANRYIALVVAAMFIQFLAALLDLTQLLLRGKSVQSGDGISDETAPLIVSREVALSLAPGFLFLFFWFYVAVPPRGELEKPYGDRSYSRAIGIVNYPGAYHSARWDRWGFLGTSLQWFILAAVTAVPVLQVVWRTTAFTLAFSPLYNASATLEIILAAVLILKIFGNIWLSGVLSRWKTLRDYSPVISGLLLGLGVAVGNAIVFKFSETALGRFLQAVESYTLILYILIGTFYLSPMKEELPRPGSSPFVGVNLNTSESPFRVEPPSISTPDLATAIATNRPSMYYRGSRSTMTRLSSWLNRGLNRPEQREPETFVQDNESDVFPQTGDKEKSDRQYFDSYYYNTAPPFNDLKKAPEEQNDVIFSTDAPKQDNPPKDIAVERPSQPSSPVIEVTDPIESPIVKPPSIARDSSTGSPVYGLNGIIRSDKYLSSRTSRASDMSSLLRQQAELDKSVAGLQLYSSSPGDRSRLTTGYSPTQSEFSLSRFPEPPIALDPSRLSTNTITGDDFVVDSVEFTLVPPRMPGASGGRQTSFPLSSRGSDNGSIDVPGRTRMYDSNGTQYDVTSFIGGLTAPASAGAQTATVPGLATIPSDDEVSPSAFTALRPAPRPRPDPPQTQVAALVPKSGLQTIQPQPELEPATTRRPNASLRRPQISAPLVRNSVDQPAAFERPRRPPAAAAPPSASK